MEKCQRGKIRNRLEKEVKKEEGNIGIKRRYTKEESLDLEKFPYVEQEKQNEKHERGRAKKGR